MSSTATFASGLSDDQLLKLAMPNVDVPGAFAHSRDLDRSAIGPIAHLILADAHHHDIFINDRGFHNHLIHGVLADFSLGAPLSRVKDMHDLHEPQTRPARAPKDAVDWSSDACFGIRKYYPSFLSFFIRHVQENGVKETLKTYLFGKGQREYRMLERFLGGVYHPMIHTGYGVEWHAPLLVAEGLAQAAVHSFASAAPFADAISASPASLSKTDARVAPSESPLSIARRLKEDETIRASLGKMRLPSFDLVTQNKDICRRILEYAGSLQLTEDRADLRIKAGRLMAFSAAMLCGPQNQIKSPSLNFFIMHSLTSSLFLSAFIEILDARDAWQLVRLKFAIDLGYYCGQGCPELNVDQFKQSPAPSWDEVFEAARTHQDEHLPKAVRALKHACDYDKNHTIADGDASLADQIYRGMAKLTIDGDGDWSFD